MQLYDLYERDENGIKQRRDAFRMRAPIETIDTHLRLHKDAVERIKRECAVAPFICELYNKGNCFIVQLAMSDLPPTREQ